MDEQGWIRLHRQIQDSELWLSDPFTWAQAWIDLLLMANYKDSMFLLRGNVVKVKRGEIARSERTLSTRWRWSRNKVRRFLKWLKTEQQIKQQQSNVINIIKIVNYEKYQQNDTTERPQKDHRKTTEGTHLKNVKNVKNEKKKEYLENSDEFQLVLFCQKRILENFPNLNPPGYKNSIQKQCDCVNKLITIDKKSETEIRTAINFATGDDFWKENFQSVLKLRRKNKDDIKYIDVFLSKSEDDFSDRMDKIDDFIAKREAKENEI